MENSNTGGVKVVSAVVIDPIGLCVKILAQCLIHTFRLLGTLALPLHKMRSAFLNKQMFSISSQPHLTMCVLKLICCAVYKF